MAGLGKYTKGKAFTLKSGNKPAFKMMGNIEAGDSPITNEFGIGKGTSPYKQKEHKDSWGSYRKNKAGEWEYKKEGDSDWTVQSNQKGIDAIEKKFGSQVDSENTGNGNGNGNGENIESGDGDGDLGFLGKLGVTVGRAALGGLNAVYGNKQAKAVKFSDDEDETDELTIDEKIAIALGKQKKKEELKIKK